MAHEAGHVVVAFGEDATLADTPASRPAVRADTGDRADGSGPLPAAVPGDGHLPPAALCDDALRSATAALVTRLLGEVLQYDPDDIDPTVHLVEYGIESLAILDMTARLEQLFGPLPKTVFFEYLNVEEVTGYFVDAHREKLREVLGTQDAREETADGTGESHERDERSERGDLGPSADGDSSLPAASVPAEVVPAASVASVSVPSVSVASEGVARDEAAPQDGPAVTAAPVAGTAASLAVTERPAAPDDRHDIAIVGISGRYPGAATMDELWELLSEGRHSFEEVPRERWDHDAIYSRDRAKLGKSVIRTGTFLRDIDKFDPGTSVSPSGTPSRCRPRSASSSSSVWRPWRTPGTPASRSSGSTRETSGCWPAP